MTNIKRLAMQGACDALVEAGLDVAATLAMIGDKHGLSMDDLLLCVVIAPKPAMYNLMSDGLSYNLTLEQWQEINKEMQDNKKINAIKLVRDITGWGLKESKHVIDTWRW